MSFEHLVKNKKLPEPEVRRARDLEKTEVENAKKFKLKKSSVSHRSLKVYKTITTAVVFALGVAAVGYVAYLLIAGLYLSNS